MTHRHVDVGTMVEITTPQGPFVLPHLLRDADIREVPDLTTELRRVKHDPSASSSGRWLQRAGPAATRIPGVIPARRACPASSVPGTFASALVFAHGPQWCTSAATVHGQLRCLVRALGSAAKAVP